MSVTFTVEVAITGPSVGASADIRVRSDQLVSATEWTSIWVAVGVAANRIGVSISSAWTGAEPDGSESTENFT